MGRKYLDITGRKFGLLTALFRTKAQDKNNRTYVWTCECLCGNLTNVRLNSLTSGLTRSCGCLKNAPLRGIYNDSYSEDRRILDAFECADNYEGENK